MACGHRAHKWDYRDRPMCIFCRPEKGSRTLDRIVPEGSKRGKDIFGEEL